jgi:hypothetical protein
MTAMAEVVLVEQVFDPPLTDEEHDRMARRVDSCLQLRHGRWMRSYLSADCKRMICEFEAPDAQSIRDAFRSAGVAFEKVWSGQLFKRD